MENNNEVERAKAWFNGQSSENLFRLHRQYFPEVSLLSKGLSDVQIVHIYNAEHPESKEPQSDAELSQTNFPTSGKRSAEQTYSIEEVVQWLKDGNAIENDCDKLGLLIKVLNVAHPKVSIISSGSFKYYFTDKQHIHTYDCSDYTTRPTIKLSKIKDSKTADITPNKRYDSDLVKEVEDCRGVDAYEEGVSLSGFISQPIQLAWKPKEDITAYELAMCLPILLHGHIYTELPDEPHFRHFEVNKQPPY